MKKTTLFIFMCTVLLTGLLTSEAYAKQVWIRDILTSPDQYWNIEVTITGEVQTVAANPAGTTRGIYIVRDDSCIGDQFIEVRTKDLPPVGKSYSITGVVVMKDPTAATPVALINEISRTKPGFPSWMKIVLIGGGILFLTLLIILIVLLVKPKKAKPEPIRPAERPEAPPPSQDPQTRKVETPAPAAESAEDRTRAYLNLRAEVAIEKGANQGKIYSLHKLVTTIGRPGARKNDIELPDDTVSKEQASIFYDNTTREFTIRNESTTNPTQVNQKVVTDPVKLDNNDLLEIGATALRFKKEE
ncbi:MAG: FHA domain-containing protein [Candidatus Aminicenantes bacterium]